MNGPRWGVYRAGVLAATSNIESGAYAKAGKLILQRGWKAEEIQVKPMEVSK